MKKALLLTIAALFTVVASNAVFAKTEKETTEAATAAPAEATETVKPADAATTDAATAAPAEATETVKPADAATTDAATAAPAEAATEKPADETAKPEKK